MLIESFVHFKEDDMFYIRFYISNNQERSFVFPKETDKFYQSKILLLGQKKAKIYSNYLIGDLCTQLKAETILNSYSARLRSQGS